MIPAKRRSHRRRRLHKRRVTFAALTVALLAGLPAIWFVFRGISNPSQAKGGRGRSEQAINAVCSADGPHWPVFKYSVVSGGVQSAAELAAAANRDSVVRDHYQGINLNNVRNTRLDKNVLAYVSYRVKDKILWTTNKIQLQKGELVLTDGVNLVRGRCGNRISLSKVVPNPGPEPAEPEFDLEEPEAPEVAVNAPPIACGLGLDEVPPPAPFVPPAAVVSNSIIPDQPVASRRLLPFIVPAAVLVGGSIGEISSSHGEKVVPSTSRPVTVAPEPSGYVWLLAIGLAWIVLRSRRNQSRCTR
jgi:hypothetical protein